jgi:signal transduction histidine kinase
VAYHLEQTLRTGELQQFVFAHEANGESREYHARLCRCGGDQVLVLVRETKFEKLREKEIVEITNREQARIGQDLHDGLGQQLTGISFLSRALEQKLAARRLSEAADAAEICRLVVQTLAQTRNLARGLFPVELEGNGLASALKQLGQEVEKLFKITCAVECSEGLVIQDRGTANHLFRLAQEAINNSVKHGKAKRVSLSLERLNGSAVLSICDDGIGFRDNALPGQGLGLRIMNYRAQKVGGTLDVRTAPAGGVHIRCTFPYTMTTQRAAP